MTAAPARPPAIQRRRRRRVGAIAAMVGLVAICFVNHWRYRGDDVARFDGRPCRVARADAIDAIEILSPDGGPAARVRLLGIDATELTGAERGTLDQRIQQLLNGQTVTINLEHPPTRDPDGRLRAYLYLADTDCLQVRLLREGLVKLDFKDKCIRLPLLQPVEQEARRHKRGIWAEL